MKIMIALIALCSTAVLMSLNTLSKQTAPDALEGAWLTNTNGSDFSLLFADGYCMFTQYNLKQKKFIVTSGGPYTFKDGKLLVKVQFHSANKSEVSKEQVFNCAIKKNELTTSIEGLEMKWLRVDAGEKNLAGNWRITHRKQGEAISEIPLRARRTLKLLTATRFQWAAINIETGEFSGTGGGKYEFKDGKYTETIEFFSRDSSRVGMALSFDGKLENESWIHSGKSSKGDPIYEIWGRLKANE